MRACLGLWIRTIGVALISLGGGATVGCNRGPREVPLALTVVSAPDKEGGPSVARFDRRELYVPSGTQVVLTLHNSIPSPVVAHNFVLVQPGSVDEVAAAAATLPIGSNPGKLPSETAVLASSPLVAPGQKVTFRFIAPPAGYYEFLCTAPGDPPTQRMRGKFVVQ